MVKLTRTVSGHCVAYISPRASLLLSKILDISPIASGMLLQHEYAECSVA